MNMATSIGRIHYENYHRCVREICAKEGIDDIDPLMYERDTTDLARNGHEAGAKAVLLYALDLMVAAGVTPAEAAAQLRAGRTIEEVCADSHPEDPDPRVMKQAHALLDAGLSARETAIELDAAGLRAPRRAPKAAGTLVSNLSDTMAQYERDLAAERAGLPLGPMSVGRPKG